uniref:Phospholipid scramblase n=1 Tax=Clastoptera arizonana TaxID=38151 RepID=A0A1B6DVY3_9HEMI
MMDSDKEEDNSAFVHDGNEEETTDKTNIIPVYTEKTVITVQPYLSEGARGDRYPLPIFSVSNWRNNIIPLTGLQFLVGVEQLSIQQTIELHDLLSDIESENRYVIKIAGGETVFVGSETSSSLQRCCCRSSRSFEIKLLDPTKQIVLILRRRLACNTGIFGCYLQRLDILDPRENLIGSIVQEWTLFVPRFVVKDDKQNILYYIKGPNVCPCAMFKEATFQVLNKDTDAQVASISHNWEHMSVSYNLKLTFPSHNMECNQKAMLIGAAFLLEYMFFETAKKPSCFKC